MKEEKSLVDEMMMIRLFEFSREVTALYEKFDLKKLYEKTLEFVTSEVAGFYLDYSKYRRRRKTHDASLDKVLHHLVNTILLTAAPILPFTAQEAFESLQI